MKPVKAYAIFTNINSDQYTVKQKGEAIYEILRFATHMSITKDNMLNVIKYLFPMAYTVEAAPSGAGEGDK